MKTNTDSKRRRGRPAQVNLTGPQTLIASHCKGAVKLALMEEANASEMSLSQYVSFVLEGLSREERIAAKDLASRDPELSDDTMKLLEKLKIKVFEDDATKSVAEVTEMEAG